VSFTSYDGTRLAFTRLGDGPPLLCLPGGPGGASSYLGDLGGLDAVRSLLLLDPRGCGHSELPADPATMRFDRQALDLEALRQHLGLEVLDVLGHSAGAITAQAWASQFPASVGRLLLVTPSDHLQGGTRDDVPGIRATYGDEPWYADALEAVELLKDAPPSQVSMLRKAMHPFFYSRWDSETQAHAARFEATMSKRGQLGYITGTDEIDFAALVAGLREVTAPVLVVSGSRDAMSGHAAGELVAGSFPNASVVTVEGAGHHPWLDDVAGFRAAVDAFVTL
jgi:pimeloyl-ACP methyl ester carboxylesterase